eukprot:SAG22_NODE_3564_length_1640_cov_1.006489_2_plen_152_part_00
MLLHLGPPPHTQAAHQSGLTAEGALRLTELEKEQRQVSRKTLSFYCGSTVILSKTVPFLAVCLSLQLDSIYAVIRQAIRGRRKVYGQTVTEIKNLFAAADRDGSGAIDRQEFGVRSKALPSAVPPLSFYLRQCLFLRFHNKRRCSPGSASG